MSYGTLVKNGVFMTAGESGIRFSGHFPLRRLRNDCGVAAI